MVRVTAFCELVACFLCSGKSSFKLWTRGKQKLLLALHMTEKCTHQFFVTATVKPLNQPTIFFGWVRLLCSHLDSSDQDSTIFNLYGAPLQLSPSSQTTIAMENLQVILKVHNKEQAEMWEKQMSVLTKFCDKTQTYFSLSTSVIPKLLVMDSIIVMLFLRKEVQL